MPLIHSRSSWHITQAFCFQEISWKKNRSLSSDYPLPFLLMGKWVHELDISPKMNVAQVEQGWPQHATPLVTWFKSTNRPQLKKNRIVMEYSRTHSVVILRKTDLSTDDFLEFPIRFLREDKHWYSLPVWRDNSHAFPWCHVCPNTCPSLRVCVWSLKSCIVPCLSHVLL